MTADLSAIDHALARLRGGDAETALALLTAMPPAPRDAARHAALGMVHLATARFAPALAALRMAVALGERSPATLLNPALAEDRAGDAERAGQLIALLRTTFPDWDEPALRAAESLRRQGDARAAEDAYEAVLDIAPARPEALISLAMLLLGRGEAARAQMLLLRGCAAVPGNPQAWDGLGMALLLTGDAAAAASAFAEAGRLAPGDTDIALRHVQAAVAAGHGAAELCRL